MTTQHAPRDTSSGFTLLEVLAVLAIVAVIASLLVPVLHQGRAAAERAVCCGNLGTLFKAYTMYLDDHDGEFFKWREVTSEGTQWYWGLERGGSGEGSRNLDKSRAKLSPYFGHSGQIEICPALRYKAGNFKQKFDVASYGYGINVYMLSDTPANQASGVKTFYDINRPSDTIVWADAAQINTWQAPASGANPMIEEWYFVDGARPYKFHFRHNRKCNAVFADGSVRGLDPVYLDDRCDGLTGTVEPPGQSYLLKLLK